MKWFKHKTNASEREFLKELEHIFGLEGYARWFKLLEKIGSVMGGENGCSASFPWSDWQTFLKGKRNKLETFLEHLENKRRINRKLTGNILEIECPKILEIKDNYTTNLQVTDKKLSPRVKSKEIQSKDKKLAKAKASPPPKESSVIKDSTKIERAWSEAFREKYGQEPEINFGQGRKILNDLLSRHGFEEVLKRARRHIENGKMLNMVGLKTLWNDLGDKPTQLTTFQKKRAVADEWLAESKANDERRVLDGDQDISQLRRAEPGQSHPGSLVPNASRDSP